MCCIIFLFVTCLHALVVTCQACAADLVTSNCKLSLCMHSCVIPEHQQSARSGAIHAVVTVCTRDLTEALTLREVARPIVVPVPTEIDARCRRFAFTCWMQPRGPGAELGT